ncbi:EsV-1-60 [Ectocarpus siliculosus virus 1]|uniref:EsV-1-60 n=1 Tax=Ectocarpus siliculosus virus 1 (isolate New Zealand/Kaikoura/1988) TaxID=654926 RepID=Q8QKV8_ESV1K|nr:EsV-1-60 [Ectocarpus siliculosus virus 1]AAK14483.1 EsV-1-60 [Ectocarpus siliculosus virus 1]
MLRLLTENKLASIGAAAMVTGVVLLLSASAVDTEAIENDDGTTVQLANVTKKKTLLALGGSVLSLGVLAQVYDQYTRYTSVGRSLSSSQYRSSSEMSPQELSRFQDRVSAAAAKLRRSIAQTSDEGMRSSGLEQESAAELAARASAQISSFIQNYS